MLYPSPSTNIVRIDILFEAGTRYQTQPLQARCTSSLFYKATKRQDLETLAEYLDSRGIQIDCALDCSVANFTVYTLSKYAHDLIPILREMFDAPVFPENELQVFLSRTRASIAKGRFRTSQQAMRALSQCLYGEGHPLARFATEDDTERITLDCLRAFFAERFRLDEAYYVLSGAIDDALVARFQQYFPSPTQCAVPGAPMDIPLLPAQKRFVAVPNAQQNTVSMGRVLNLAGTDARYAQLSLLNTIFGGFFGSRLMANIREEKGYTYGISSNITPYRNATVLRIATDVACDVWDDTVAQIQYEMRRLCSEPVGAEELELARQWLLGAELRLYDGVFEQVEARLGLVALGIPEETHDRLLAEIPLITSDQIQALACEILNPDEFTLVVAGDVAEELQDTNKQ